MLEKICWRVDLRLFGGDLGVGGGVGFGGAKPTRGLI